MRIQVFLLTNTTEKRKIRELRDSETGDQKKRETTPLHDREEGKKEREREKKELSLAVRKIAATESCYLQEKGEK